MVSIFAILQELGELPNLIEGLHSSLIGSDKTCELSSRKQPKRSSIAAAAQTFVFLKNFLCQFL